MQTLRAIGVHLALTASLLLSAFPARAQLDPKTMSRDQLATYVAQSTGMAKDAVGLALKETPKALEKVSDAVVGVQVIAMLSEARDEDAAVAATQWALGKVKDKLVTGPAGTALTAVGLYKDALEAVRDYAYIPALEESIYLSYRAQRFADAAPNPESAETAYAFATQRGGTGYFAVKEKIFQEMVKRAGMKGQAFDKRGEDLLRKKIDNYWKSKMEVRFQREYLRENRSRLTGQAWEQVRAQVNSRSQLPKGLGADPEAEAAIARYIAAEEARIPEMIARMHAQGYPDALFRLEWVVRPHLEKGCMMVASQILQKPTKNHEWTGAGSYGSAEQPMCVPISEIKRKYAK